MECLSVASFQPGSLHCQQEKIAQFVLALHGFIYYCYIINTIVIKMIVIMIMIITTAIIMIVIVIIIVAVNGAGRRVMH